MHELRPTHKQLQFLFQRGKPVVSKTLGRSLVRYWYLSPLKRINERLSLEYLVTKDIILIVYMFERM